MHIARSFDLGVYVATIALIFRNGDDASEWIRKEHSNRESRIFGEDAIENGAILHAAVTRLL